MHGFDALVLLLIVVGLLYSGRHAVPVAWALFRPDSVRSWFVDRSTEQQQLARSDKLQNWLAQLQQMGFVLLGVRVEKAPLWDGSTHEVELVSPSAETYAGILLYADGRPASLSFYTPFQKTGMVFTRNFANGRELESERISAKNVVSTDFAQILADHQQRLEVLKKRGLTPLVGADQASRLEANQLYYRSAYGKHATLFHNKIYLALFPVFLVLFLSALF